MLYNAVLILGTNELGPVNAEEMCFVSIALILSSLLNAWILGDMISLVGNLASGDNEKE